MIEIDREELSDAIEEVEALLAMIDAMPRLFSESPQDFVHVLREVSSNPER